MNLKFKIGGLISCGAIIAGSTTLGLVYGLKTSSSSKKGFNPLSYKGKVFSSHNDLMDYINNNSEQITQEKGDSVFSVNLGNDLKEFFNYNEAHKYIMANLHSMEVYVKPNAQPDPVTNTFSSNQFIEKEIFYNDDGTIDYQKTNDHDNGNKYYAFQKRSNLGDGINFKEGAHSYILVRANASPDEIDEARKKAAATYVQIHSAYLFDGKYFKTKNDIKTYILLNQSSSGFEKKLDQGNYYQLLINGSGTSYNFNLPNASTPDQVYQQLLADKKFKNAIANSSTPYYTYTDGNLEHSIKINDGNLPQIAAFIDESDLEYIQISPNGDKKLEIVDMDNSTPNGDIFGNYFTENGMGLEEIYNISNWNESNEKSIEKKEDLVDVTILKGAINYILSSKGYKTPFALFGAATLSQNGPTLFEYLNGYNTDFKDSYNGKEYLKDIGKLIKNISKGRRYNHLDAIIAMYKRIIDNMLVHGENVKAIITVANYFNSISKFLDSMLQIFLNPFFGLDSQLQNDSNINNFKINYFENAFNFYDPTVKGGAIDIQKDPYSYYGKLLGLKGDQTTSYKKNRNIFHLIQAAMGLHSLSMKGLIHNQRKYSLWAKKSINNIKYNNYNFDKLVFSTNKNDLRDFTFSESINDANQNEQDGIWNNIINIEGLVETSNINFSKQQIIKNFQSYIQHVQNPYIKKYMDRMKIEIDRIYSMYHSHDVKQVINGKEQTKQIPAKKYDSVETPSDFYLNTISFIDINISDISTGTFVTTADKIRHLHKMVESAVKPLKERIKDLAVVAGTVIAKTAIAFATAGAVAETTMVESSLSSSVVFSKERISFKSSNNFAFQTSRSSLHRTSNWTVNVTTISKKNKKKLSDKVSDAITSFKDISPHQSANIGDSIASFMSPLNIVSMIFPNSASIIKDINDVVMKIAANVLPPLSMLFSVINSFSKSETQTYYYNQNTGGDSYYWNGGLVDYSWWGLSADQKFSINDLKMIETQIIVSGHPKEKSGFYYNGKYYDTLDRLKMTYAQNILNKLRSANKYKMSKKTSPFMKHIKWDIHLAGLSDPFAKTTLSELIKKSAEAVANTPIAKKLYKLANSSLTTNVGKALDDSIDALLNTIKPVLIIRLPDIEEDGNIKVEDEFSLPKPYFDNGGVVENQKPNEVTRIIIINPNIHKDTQNIPTFPPGSDEEEKYKQLEKAREDIANQEYEKNPEFLMALIMEYIDYLHIPVKKVIWEEVSGSIAGNIHRSFEELNEKWSSQVKTIYNFKTIEGQQMYYSERDAAIRALLSDSNYKINQKVRGRTTVTYKFEGQLFSSINQIYDYIIKQAFSKKNALLMEEKWN